jgi:hypothetical protein
VCWVLGKKQIGYIEKKGIAESVFAIYPKGEAQKELKIQIKI